jgi:hypothetical protein
MDAPRSSVSALTLNAGSAHAGTRAKVPTRVRATTIELARATPVTLLSSPAHSLRFGRRDAEACFSMRPLRRCQER